MLLPESVAAAFNAADDAERDHQAAGLRAFEDARDQLSAMGVSVLMRVVAPEDRVRGVVLREFDRDGRFTVIVDGRGGAEQRSEILREAVDVILRHDAYRWHIASPEDHRGVGAATSFAFVTISPAGSASSQVGSPRPRAQ